MLADGGNKKPGAVAGLVCADLKVIRFGRSGYDKLFFLRRRGVICAFSPAANNEHASQRNKFNTK